MTTITDVTEITSTVSTTTSCFGYDVCPEYPQPYGHGEWPSEYTYSGSFPDGFVWGLGTASYQIEGGYQEGGRGASIWDTFTGANTIGMPGADCGHCCKTTPCPVNEGMSAKGATGNVACDHYHLWRSDIALMKSMGLRHYRFSIAWARIVPTGRIADGINEEGIAFYSDLLDGLIAAGITPSVTLYHWDLPQGLLDPPRVNGWWSRDDDGRPNGEILDDWLGYVSVCFERFGDRVKMWFTFNEAWTSSFLAPARAWPLASRNSVTSRGTLTSPLTT
jgi:beta-glucosidase/6-phospho-beta-glucosidase/beta-galactosidase